MTMIDTGHVAEATELLALLERDPAAALTNLLTLIAERNRLTRAVEEARAELEALRRAARDHVCQCIADHQLRAAPVSRTLRVLQKAIGWRQPVAEKE